MKSLSVQWPRFLALAIAAVALFGAGCTLTTEGIAAHLADRSLRRQHLVQIVDGDLALFRSCFAERGGSCQSDAGASLPGTAGSGQQATEPAPSSALADSVALMPAGHPARAAADTLSHPVLAKACALHDAVRGADPAGVDVLSRSRSGNTMTLGLDLSLSQVQDLQDRVGRTTASGGWKALRRHTEAQLAVVPAGSTEHADMMADHRRVLFVEKYVEAYFRNGRFVAVDLTVAAAQAQQDLTQELSRHAPDSCRVFNAGEPPPAGSGGADDECGALAQRLYQAVSGSAGDVDRQLVKVSQTGYVSRDGSYSAQFPQFQVDVDPLASHLLSITVGQGESVRTIDFTAIGTDLVRITLEAVFDAAEGLPAVPTATARQLGEASLPLFQPPMGDVSLDDFNAMTAINQRTSAAVGVAVDRLVRGLGPFSLNNAALEQLIVTLVTTSVREAVAKASWCWYACNLDVQLEQAEADLKARVRSEEHDLEQKVKKAARRDVEQVELALKIHP